MGEREAVGGDHAAGQVEQQISEPAEPIFDVVTEDPQEQHVAEQV